MVLAGALCAGALDTGLRSQRPMATGKHHMLRVLGRHGHREDSHTDSGTSLGIKELLKELICVYLKSLRKMIDMCEERTSVNKVQNSSMSELQRRGGW